MYDFTTDNVLNAIYSPNDRLGVELMGAPKWNALKKAVASNTVNQLNKIYGGNRNKFIKRVIKAANAVRNNDQFNAVGKSARIANVLNDPLCAELWGINGEYADELLGYSFSDFTRQVKKVTHKALEAGENIPIIDAAVSRFRDVTGAITGAKSAADVATVAYDNRGKIILIGGGAAILLYLLLRKKGRR